jgi:poly(hydroxyalkanoate) depolymerase family esterase
MGEVIRGRAECDAGARDWRLFVPTGYDPQSPPMLLVLLHGCTQNADDIARGSRMDDVADAHGFLVLYPEQPLGANPKLCWNWFDAAHQTRGAGEPAIIASMIDEVLANTPADPARVHIAGVSAGAAMATLVAVAYPERFASLTSVSGIPWGAAQQVMRALTVMANGAGADVPSPDAVLQRMGRHPYAMPLLAVHGAGDAVVSPHNLDELVSQWTGVHDAIAARRGTAALTMQSEVITTEGEYTVHRTEWHDAEHVPQVVRLLVDELGHAWAGGSPDGSFTDAKGPSTAQCIAEFCVPHRRRHV